MTEWLTLKGCAGVMDSSRGTAEFIRETKIKVTKEEEVKNAVEINKFEITS